MRQFTCSIKFCMSRAVRFSRTPSEITARMRAKMLHACETSQLCDRASMHSQHALEHLKEAYIRPTVSWQLVSAASACRRTHRSLQIWS